MVVLDLGTTIAEALQPSQPRLLGQRSRQTGGASVGRANRTSLPGFSSMADGTQKIEFVNAGPGLAIQLAYLLWAGGLRSGAIVGSGHLHAGDRALVDVAFGVPGPTASFVWVCRDIYQPLHIWSYSGEHKHLKRGDYPNLGEAFIARTRIRPSRRATLV